MKWEVIEFEKLKEGDVFRSESIPDRVYQVDELGKDVEGKPYLMASELVKGSTELCFSGGGEPYYRLKVPGAEAIDAIAGRLVESQEELKQKTARFGELLQKWEDKRVEEQTGADNWEDVDWQDIQVDDQLRWRYCNGKNNSYRSQTHRVVHKNTDTVEMNHDAEWIKENTKYQYQRLTKNCCGECKS